MPVIGTVSEQPISRDIGQLLRRPKAYVRARGFEPEQMKQTIVQKVQAHGQNSRKSVMVLCRLSAPRAYRLLQSLEEGKLTRGSRGTGRGAPYVVSQICLPKMAFVAQIRKTY